MKNKFKKLAGLLLAAVMALAVLPIQTLASEWGKGDTVYAAMLGDYVGSDGKSYGDKRNYTFMYYKSSCQLYHFCSSNQTYNFRLLEV